MKRLLIVLLSLVFFGSFFAAPAEAATYRGSDSVQCVSLVLPTYCRHNINTTLRVGSDGHVRKAVVSIDDVSHLDRPEIQNFRVRIYKNGRKISDRQLGDIFGSREERRNGTVRQSFNYGGRPILGRGEFVVRMNGEANRTVFDSDWSTRVQWTR